MDKRTRQMLNDAEQELLRSTEPDRLKKLDEDELLELHGRVRRARNKYSKLHRRRAAAKVPATGSRARATAASSRTAMKAELFEDTLAAVSRRLARVAWDSADQLRRERLAAARAAKGKAAESGPKSKGKGKKGSKGSGNSKATSSPTDKRRTPASKRDAAAARAATRRKQAKRDKR